MKVKTFVEYLHNHWHGLPFVNAAYSQILWTTLMVIFSTKTNTWKHHIIDGYVPIFGNYQIIVNVFENHQNNMVE